MMFNVSNVIAENLNESALSLLNRSLFPINEVFDKQNRFGTSIYEQMFKQRQTNVQETIGNSN